MLGLSNRITRTEAYGDASHGERLDIALRFHSDGGARLSGLPFELYQNTPNPWVSRTRIGFYLPEAAGVTLAVHDEMGRLVYTQTGSYPRGYNTALVERTLLGSGNAFSYTLHTPFGSATRKMILVR